MEEVNVKYWKTILLITLTAGLVFGLSFTAISKSLPKERLVPSIGLLGTTADYSPQRYNMQRMIVASWKKLGIDAYNDPTKYEAMIKRAFRSKQFDTYIINWSPMLVRLEPNVFLRTMLHSENAGWDGINVSGYQSLAYDKLADAQKVALQTKDRKDIIDFIQQFLYERQPHHAFLHHKIFRAYNKKNFSDVILAPGTGPWSFWFDWSCKPTGAQKVVRQGGPADFKTLNPIMAQLITDQYLLRHIYDTLMRIGPDAKPQLWAATAVNWVDEKTLDVTVRTDMKFHDGKPVRMEDIKFSYEYAPKSGYLKSFVENVAGVEIKGPGKLRFTLKEPDAGFLFTVLCQVQILPEHIWGKIENPATFANDKPIGSGPFAFEYYRRDEELKLKAYKEHFNPPRNEGMLHVVYGNIEAIVGAMEQGQLDSCAAAVITPAQKARLDKVPFIQTVEPLTFGAYMLEYNTRIAPLNDVHFRRAISYAVPVDPMIKRIWEGHAVPAGAMLSPENKFWHNSKLPPWPFSMEKAREELKKAGYEWDDKGRLYYPAPENDKRWIDTVDRYEKHSKTWGKN
jgi:peptide/nickel transport system substrate-binding protein